MLRITSQTPAVPFPVPAAVQVPEDALLNRKLADLHLRTKYSAQVNWKNKRIVTLSDHVVVKDEHKNKEITRKSKAAAARVFKHKSGDAQGLFLVNEHRGACTVSTGIINPKNRKTEEKSTFIQFDKTTIEDENADFKVPSCQKVGRKAAFYSGCHLNDHKYITGNAHTDPDNYFPGNYFYNVSIRNWLVNPKRTSAYVEIPVYTPNPPMIKSKGYGEYAIPACVFFIRICPPEKNQKSKVIIYCFPNNSYDYEDTKKYLELKKGDSFGEKMALYFELNPDLHLLFKPAIIHTLREKQLEKEEGMADLLQELMQFEANEGAISQLGEQVIQHQVDPYMILPECEDVCNPALREALGFAGDFLVNHALQNVLKAETFSIKARLSFISAIIDCIEQTSVISDEEYDFFHRFDKQLSEVFKELNSLIKELKVDDLLLLSSTYFNMTSSFTLPYAWEDGGLLSEDEFEEYYKTGVQVLKELVARRPKTFDKNQMRSFLSIIHNADQTLDLLSDLDQEEFYEEEGNFLYECRALCLSLIRRLKGDEDFNGIEWKARIASLGFEPNSEEE